MIGFPKLFLSLSPTLFFLSSPFLCWRDQLTEYMELKAIEKKIDELVSRIPLKVGRSDEEIDALELNWLN
jgi:hypothetical protein